MQKTKSKFPGLLVLGAVLFTTACQKQPPVQNLSSNLVVLTNHDSSADFKSYKTFVLSDSIAICNSNPIRSFWSDSNARAVIREVAVKMQAAGYAQLPASDSSNADLNIKLVGILNVTVYNQSPGYWWGYPGYPDFYYWGNPGWNPYPYYYTVMTGSLIVEMADLKNVDKNKGLNIVWSAINSGQLGYTGSFIASQCVTSIDQAFLQSPYLKSN